VKLAEGDVKKQATKSLHGKVRNGLDRGDLLSGGGPNEEGLWEGKIEFARGVTSWFCSGKGGAGERVVDEESKGSRIRGSGQQ